MSSYFTGDELGAIKHIQFTISDGAWKSSSTTVLPGGSQGRGKAVQKLAAFTQADSQPLLAAARADGTATILAISEDGPGAETVSEWKETQLKDGQNFIGLAATSSGIYTCTSNGALRISKPNGEDHTPAFQVATLPTRLKEWRLSLSEKTFAYVGDEVEASVWNTERTFAEASTRVKLASTADDAAKKRKRSKQLLPGEVWRAKNLSNDELNLRQPVRNTALAYIQPSATLSQQHLLVGTQFGDLRRYDTRVARRPVSDWKGIGKVGGVGSIELGTHEHELFISDCGCNLYAVDLRNGTVSYGYKGLAGAVTSTAISGSHLASTSQDRYLRLHSTFPPPKEAGQRQEQKGDVLDKLYMNTVPTCIVVDPTPTGVREVNLDRHDEDADDEEVWAGMENANSDDELGQKKRKTKGTGN